MTKPPIRCAIYTRKSTEEGLEQQFNSLDAQRESGETFIASQRHEGWICLPQHYDDGGYTGGNMERPALKQLMADIEAGQVDCVVVYKVDRLSRSLMDFARMMETFERKKISFVSVTQHFNTSSPMGRLILNVLLSFAQFERELNSERTRDKIAAMRRRGKWSGGRPLLGYDVERSLAGARLVVNDVEAEQVRQIFSLYLELKGVVPVANELNDRGWINKAWQTRKGKSCGGRHFDKGSVYKILTNTLYLGKVRYKTEFHAGEHSGIVSAELWEAVQTMLKANGLNGGSDVRSSSGALLQGLLHCSACNRRMGHTYSSKGSRRYRYYVCQKAQKEGRKSCPAPSVPAAEIERFVVDQVRQIARNPALMAEALVAYRIERDAQGAAQDTERRRLEAELSRHHAALLELAGQGHSPLLTSRLAEVHDAIRSTEAKIASIRPDESSEASNAELVSWLASFDPVWGELAPRERREILAQLIERVDFDGAEGNMKFTFHELGLRALDEVAA